MKKCLHCMKEFDPTKPKQVYCSSHCRTKSHRKKHHGYELPVIEITDLPEEQKMEVTFGEPLESTIDFKAVTPESYDAPPLSRFIADEAGQWPTPAFTSDKWIRRESTPMPEGLSAFQQLLWKAEQKKKI